MVVRALPLPPLPPPLVLPLLPSFDRGRFLLPPTGGMVVVKPLVVVVLLLVVVVVVVVVLASWGW